MDFSTAIAESPVILTEGATIERLRRFESVALDPHVEHAHLVYQAPGREMLATICRQYLDIGRHVGLPMIISPPTWRANPDRVSAAGLGDCERVNRDCVAFTRSIRAECHKYARAVYLGGLLGCRGDAYNPAEALEVSEAARFHRTQVNALASAGVDFLLAATLPAASEARGIARALAITGLPYVLSFVLQPDGTLLDGTPVRDAIQMIDTETTPPPLCYMANCVHAAVFIEALGHACRETPELHQRLIGLQANTAHLSPNELDGSAELVTEAPETFATAMLNIHRRYNVRILGGCCGTDDRHIRAMAQHLTRI